MGSLFDSVLNYVVASFISMVFVMWIPPDTFGNFFGELYTDEIEWARYVTTWTVWLGTMLGLLVMTAKSRQVYSEIALFSFSKSPDLGIVRDITILLILILLFEYGLSFLFPEEFSYDSESWQYLLSSSFRYVMFFNLLVLGPVFEEILYRGLLYPTLAESKIGKSGGAIVSSLIWAMTHFYPWPVTLGIFVSGLAMCYLRQKSGSLWPSLSLHISLNFISTITIVFFGNT